MTLIIHMMMVLMMYIYIVGIIREHNGTNVSTSAWIFGFSHSYNSKQILFNSFSSCKLDWDLSIFKHLLI